MDISTEESKLKDIMGRAWGIDPIDVPVDVELNNFPQWDSVGHVSLLVELEKEYNIAINYKAITELTSIPAIIEHLNGEKHA